LRVSLHASLVYASRTFCAQLEQQIDFMSLQANLFGDTIYSYRQQLAMLLDNQRRLADEA
jgi:hypothetical protein